MQKQEAGRYGTSKGKIQLQMHREGQPTPAMSGTINLGKKAQLWWSCACGLSSCLAVLWSPGTAPLPAPLTGRTLLTQICGHSLHLLGTDVTEHKINALIPKYLSTQQLSQTLSDFNNEQIKAAQLVPADKGCAAQVDLITFSPENLMFPFKQKKTNPHQKPPPSLPPQHSKSDLHSTFWRELSLPQDKALPGQS